ncbi:MAG: thiolase family protein [Chitinophagales bacterium]
MREAVIVTGVRTAIGKAPKGTLKDIRPEFLGKVVVEGAVERLGANFDKSLIEDVFMGCSFPESEQGLNMARIVALFAGLPETTCGVTINRFCSSGLQSVAMACERIIAGGAEIIMAAGVESMSRVYMNLKPAPNPDVWAVAPNVYLPMGATAENVAQKFGITREEQDALALASHQKAAAAINSGRFVDEIVPVPVKKLVTGEGDDAVYEDVMFAQDEGVRFDISSEKLAGLRPVFNAEGSVTAGSSSQTSDGAAAVVVMSADKAKELGLRPRLKFRSFAVGGVDPGLMGIGPVAAIPKALKLAGLTLKDIGLIELNEAFASQAVYCIKTLGLNPNIVNVNGGAIALGHPLGCTGTKLTVQIMHEMEKRGVKYGMVSMCIGGGMGAAGIYELI